MNYAEEAAFWYLRLNGFFAITNFVVHKSEGGTRTSDCDVMGVRLPHTYQEIGGQDDDWDRYLVNNLNFKQPLGVICEVKGGAYEERDLFRTPVLEYVIGRLGFVPRNAIGDVVADLNAKPVAVLADGTQIAKLLVARRKREGPYLLRGLADVEQFLKARVEKYPQRKYGDRLFFGPVLFQAVIEQTAGHLGE